MLLSKIDKISNTAWEKHKLSRQPCGVGRLKLLKVYSVKWQI